MKMISLTANAPTIAVVVTVVTLVLATASVVPVLAVAAFKLTILLRTVRLPVPTKV
jgi:hypothetical protein